jgi:ubiquinone/menaquinone biosynthesis C-methylase UbiE
MDTAAGDNSHFVPQGDDGMSTYIWMKILESAPSRYDRGIRILTFGRLEGAYERLISHVREGLRVLDVGCGTGALAVLAAKRGASVKAIDVNPRLLEIAKGRTLELGLSTNIELTEMGVAQLGQEETESYDVVTSGLSFSELSEDELRFTLREVCRILKPGGLLLAADEVNPESVLKRFLHMFIRIPLLVFTYLITQTTTNVVEDLPGKVRAAGLEVASVRFSKMGDFMELVAKKPGGRDSGSA